MTRLVLELTNSQRMALCSVLVHAITGDAGPTEYVDCSTSPATETTLGDLLQLVNTAKSDPKSDPFAGERQELLVEVQVLQRKLAEVTAERDRARGQLGGAIARDRQ